MSIKPIKSAADHKAAMQRIDALWDKSDRVSRDELEVLGMLVSAYEDETIPVEIDPVDLIKLRMEQQGFTQPDLSVLLGSRSRATELLNRTRPLTLPMIRALATAWKIPAAALIRESKVSGARKGGGKATSATRARSAAKVSKSKSKSRRSSSK